ncbi:MAG: hypothetical protein HPY57_14790 [Ignavibacteria bacterium]|nr:hypothetical protein [Ignavibacteria bacterium]
MIINIMREDKLLTPKKYNIFNSWLSAGTTVNFAFEKAKNNVPHFKTNEEKKQWIRQQKFKKY